MQTTPEEALAADLDALCTKHNLESGMIAVSNSNHFLIITYDMSASVMRLLGKTLLQCTPPADAVLN